MTRAFYEGGELFVALPRSSMGLEDILDVQIYYTKGGSRLLMPSGTETKLVPIKNLGSEYLSVTPESAEMTENGARFLLSSGDKVTDVVLQPTVTIPLP